MNMYKGKERKKKKGKMCIITTSRSIMTQFVEVMTFTHWDWGKKPMKYSLMA